MTETKTTCIHKDVHSRWDIGDFCRTILPCELHDRRGYSLDTRNTPLERPLTNESR